MRCTIDGERVCVEFSSTAQNAWGEVSFTSKSFIMSEPKSQYSWGFHTCTASAQMDCTEDINTACCNDMCQIMCQNRVNYKSHNPLFSFHQSEDYGIEFWNHEKMEIYRL